MDGEDGSSLRPCSIAGFGISDVVTAVRQIFTQSKQRHISVTDSSSVAFWFLFI